MTWKERERKGKESDKLWLSKTTFPGFYRTGHRGHDGWSSCQPQNKLPLDHSLIVFRQEADRIVTGSYLVNEAFER